MMNERMFWFSPISIQSLDFILALYKTLPGLIFEAICSSKVTQSGCGLSGLLKKYSSSEQFVRFNITMGNGRAAAGFWKQPRSDRVSPHFNGVVDGAVRKAGRVSHAWVVTQTPVKPCSGRPA